MALRLRPRKEESEGLVLGSMTSSSLISRLGSFLNKLMSINSHIEWTDNTWNPVRVAPGSPGCVNCYAETFAERFRGVPGHPYEQGFDLRLVPAKLAEPLRWKKPAMVFVNSMSDLFHEDVPDDYIVKVAEVMTRANWHTYQVLTKRSERLRDMLNGPLGFAAAACAYLVGRERRESEARIAEGRASAHAAAGLRMLSIEPLLEDLGVLDLRGIGWVILGGEAAMVLRPWKSRGCAPCRDQCEAAGRAVLLQAMGRRSQSRAGRLLDERTHDDIPSRACVDVPGDHVRKAWITQFEAAQALN